MEVAKCRKHFVKCHLAMISLGELGNGICIHTRNTTVNRYVEAEIARVKRDLSWGFEFLKKEIAQICLQEQIDDSAHY